MKSWAWLSGLAVAGVVGGGLILGGHVGSPVAPTVTIPRAKLQGAPQITRNEAPVASAGARSSGCVVPGLPEGVQSKDIRELSNANLSFVGGTIEKGKYRVVDAFALKPQFTPGRWTLALDLTENDQGAYYRPTGLAFRSSRIRWSVQGNRLEWETLCPDPGEHMSFEFTVVGARLYLLTREEIVVVLEPYAESQVSRLPPVDGP